MDDLRTVAAFVAVADLLHIGRAAERLGVSRATASGRLRALECRLGLCLVDRRHRCRIALTPEGTVLLPAARAALTAHAALEAAAAEVRAGTRGVVRVVILESFGGPRGVSEPVDDGALRELGRSGEALADTLAELDEGWSIEFRRMDRWSARRAMAVGAVDCAIGLGGALRLGPGALDRRPHRLERARAISIMHGPSAATSVTWRSSWAARGDASDQGAARVRDRLVEAARLLRGRAIDERFPAAAARRRATAERMRAALELVERVAEDTHRVGREVALRRAAAEERRAAIEAYEAARTAGSVSPYVLARWLVATRPEEGAPPGAPRLE